MNDPVSTKIMNIRVANGGSADVCPICTRHASSPYRRYDGTSGITEGCIDACHTRHLVLPSNTGSWHIRKEAVTLRRDTLSALSRK